MKDFRQSVVFLCDTIILVFICIGLWIFAPWLFSSFQNNDIIFLNLASLYVCTVVSQLLFQSYDTLWRYAETREYLILLLATGFGFLLYLLLNAVLLHGRIPLVVLMMISSTWMLGELFMRFCYRVYRSKVRNAERIAKIRVAIVGAGAAGLQLLQELQSNPSSKYKPVCIFDDDPSKYKKKLRGIFVVGSIATIPEYLRSHPVEQILVAIPSLTAEQQTVILQTLSTLENVSVFMLPSALDLVEGSSISSQLYKVKAEDLLGRDPIQLNTDVLSAFLKDKVILVTGGGGSIGSELCRQIAKFHPKKLVILDIYENNAYDVQQELTYLYGKQLDLTVEIASIREESRVRDVFRTYRPNVVFHAAAHKHVPLMEHNPREAVLNNVFGTYHLVQAAEDYGVEKFVQISTDKAVNPTNIMGATKRLCEMLLQSKKDCSTTDFVAVRFGNVLGSNGSVIPLFQRQIEAGGPVTVTDFRIIRYFMTIPEAAQLVLQAGSMHAKNEIYVLNMGKPVKILDLAENMIRCSGLMPYRDIDIVETGLRPGEKLYEELLIDGRDIKKTSNDQIYVETQPCISLEELHDKLSLLSKAIQIGNQAAIREALHVSVPTFKEAELVNKEKEAELANQEQASSSEPIMTA